MATIEHGAFGASRHSAWPVAAGLVAAAVATTSGVTLAQEPLKLSGLTADYSIGVMSGTGRKTEFYIAGVSRKDFKFDNVAMFNTHTSVQVLSWLRAGARTSFNVTDDGRTEEHATFATCPLKPSGANECIRTYPTRLDRAALFDVYGAGTVYSTGGVKVDLLAGYKHDNFRWRTAGGTGEGLFGGSIPPAQATSYAQTLSAPYAGIGVTVQSGALTVSGRVVGSAWARARDTYDWHIRSETETHGTLAARFVGADVSAAWKVGTYLSLTADYRFEHWSSERGPTSAYSRVTNGPAFRPFPQSGSIDTVAHIVSLGAKVDLQALATTRPMADGGRPSPFAGWAIGVAGGMQGARDRWTTRNVTVQGYVDDTTKARDYEGRGQRAGLFLGHTWRVGMVYVGLEAEAGRSNATDWRHGIPGLWGVTLINASEDSTQVGAGWDGSLRLRIGAEVLPAFLVYATGGLSVGETLLRANCAGFFSNCAASAGFERVSAVRHGWTAGFGYEWAHAGGWFTRGEYRYTALGDIAHTFFNDGSGEDVSVRISPTNHRLTFGIGYRF